MSAPLYGEVIADHARNPRNRGALESPDAAHDLLDRVQAAARPATSFMGSFSPVMVAHTGPGLVGLAWWWDG